MAQQTAVEWLFEQYKKDGFLCSQDEEQAKQKFEEQVKDGFVECWKSNVPVGVECKLDAEQYYNETYGK